MLLWVWAHKTRKLAEQRHTFIVLSPAEDGMAPAVPGYCLDSHTHPHGLYLEL